MKRGYLLKMLDLLTGAYNRSDIQNVQHGRNLETNIGRLFSLLAWGFEIIHENADMVRSWDDLENAEGAVLDRYGANFGVARGAASDALYRILIRVKMIALLSGGDSDTVIKAAGELLGVEFSDIVLEDVYPAKIALYVDQSLLSQERIDLIEQIAHAIKRILAAGVGLRLYLRTYRTYRAELNVCYGAAVGASYILLPVGQDRVIESELPISHGAFSTRAFMYEPIGQDRRSEGDIAISRGGFSSRTLSHNPVGQDRRIEEGITISRGGFASRTISHDPVSLDRWSAMGLEINRGGFVGSEFSPDLIGEDRMARDTLSVAHGAVLSPPLYGEPLPPQKSYTSKQSGAGGAFYHSHIKSKRID